MAIQEGAIATEIRQNELPVIRAEHTMPTRYTRHLLLQVEISLVGEFFTGLEMAGFSVTISRLDNELEQLILAKADACMFKMI